MDAQKKDFSENYNPFEHRQVRKPNSDIRSLANLLKASLGSGILAIPLAFANAGWAVGIAGTVIIAFICGHCVHIFVITSRECCIAVRKPLLSYAETCSTAFAIGPKPIRRFATAARRSPWYSQPWGPLGKNPRGTTSWRGQQLYNRERAAYLYTLWSLLTIIFAEFALLATYLGVCCIFTVLIADSVKQLFDSYVPEVIWPVEYYCLVFLIPLCLMVQIRYLKWLAPFSLIANVLLVVTFFICMYYIFKDEITVADKRIVGYPERFPAFLSTVIFAMEGIGVVMPVENTMKKPEHFLGCPSVMVVAMTFIMMLYSVLGLFGYFRYGDALKGSITLNLPMDDWPAICAKCFIALSIIFTYPLHFYVVIDILMKYLAPRVKKQYETLLQVLVRIAVVCFCGGIGVALPMLEQIINFVGALFYSILGLIIPGVVETVIRWDKLGKYNWILWKNILIVLFGLISAVSGCTVTILDVMEKLKNKS